MLHPVVALPLLSASLHVVTSNHMWQGHLGMYSTRPLEVRGNGTSECMAPDSSKYAATTLGLHGTRLTGIGANGNQ